MAKAALAAAGVDVHDEELPLVELVYDNMLRQFAALDAATPGDFPVAPVDPSRAP